MSKRFSRLTAADDSDKEEQAVDDSEEDEQAASSRDDSEEDDNAAGSRLNSKRRFSDSEEDENAADSQRKNKQSLAEELMHKRSALVDHGRQPSYQTAKNRSTYFSVSQSLEDILLEIVDNANKKGEMVSEKQFRLDLALYDPGAIQEYDMLTVPLKWKNFFKNFLELIKIHGVNGQAWNEEKKKYYAKCKNIQQHSDISLLLKSYRSQPNAINNIDAELLNALIAQQESNPRKFKEKLVTAFEETKGPYDEHTFENVLKDLLKKNDDGHDSHTKKQKKKVAAKEGEMEPDVRQRIMICLQKFISNATRKTANQENCQELVNQEFSGPAHERVLQENAQWIKNQITDLLIIKHKKLDDKNRNDSERKK